MNTSQSQKAYELAQKFIPGGVNSPVRNFSQTGLPHPLFIDRGKGSRIWDIDGNEYIDYVNSWGASILGHAHPNVVNAVCEAVQKGLSFGAPTEAETRLAALIREAYPSIEQVRLVNSGTEAVMSALRLARAVTGRNAILKFEGCYHGHADALLVKGGSGLLAQGEATSAGISPSLSKETLVMPYNDLERLKKVFSERGKEIACVIVEPVAGNMGLVLPKEGFLEGLRQVTRDWGALLIFDEVITGFRIGWGGAEKRYGIRPDITCLGKVIGGGLPIGAYGGNSETMRHVAPLGRMYQAGTLSGNPVAVAAGAAVLSELRGKKGIFDKLEAYGRHLVDGVSEIAGKKGIPCQTTCIGGLFSIFWTDQDIVDLSSVQRSDTALFRRLFSGLLGQGVYLAPSPFEASFVTLSHSQDDLEKSLSAFRSVL